MFIPNVVHFTSNMFVKVDEPKKHTQRISKIRFREFEPKKRVKKISQYELEHGDPNFVDERTTSNKAKEEESIFSSIFEWVWNLVEFFSK